MTEVTDEENRQIEGLYASIGRIAVHAEHLNHAMQQCCIMLLRGRDEENELVDTALAGHNLESMRRVWISMMKLHYRGDTEVTGMIDHLSRRIDAIAQRRNDTIHRLWFIGYAPARNRGSVPQGKRTPHAICRGPQRHLPAVVVAGALQTNSIPGT